MELHDMMISHYLFRPISTYFDLFHVFSTYACVVICRNMSKSNFATDGVPYTEPSLGSKLWISPEISVSLSISSPKSEAMNWSNNCCSGQWPRLTTNNAQSITVSENGSLINIFYFNLKFVGSLYKQPVIWCLFSCLVTLHMWYWNELSKRLTKQVTQVN